MKHSIKRTMGGLVLSALLATTAWAQTPPAPAPMRVRGEVESLSGSMLMVKTAGGESLHVMLAEKVAVIALKKVDMAAIKTGVYVAMTSVKNAAGVQEADEVMVFMESGRGTAEGHFPWDQGKETMMTNAAISMEVKQANGRELTLAPKGQPVKINLPASAVIVQQEMADTSLLVPGTRVYFGAQKAADGSLTAGRLLVEKGCGPSKSWVHCK